MDRALFNRVADYIEAHPDNYDQYTWADVAEPAIAKVVNHDNYIRVMEPCDTNCCIAGWGVWLTDPDLEVRAEMIYEDGVEAYFWNKVHDYRLTNIEGHAQEAFDLSDDEARFLFAAEWIPPAGMTVPQALREIGKTGKIVGTVLDRTYEQWRLATFRDEAQSHV